LLVIWPSKKGSEKNSHNRAILDVKKNNYYLLNNINIELNINLSKIIFFKKK